MKEEIRLCGKNFEIRRNPQRKRIAFGVDASGQWFIGAPDFYSRERLTKILTEDEDIAQLVAKVEKRVEGIPGAKSYAEGEEFLFRGEKYPLRWTDDPGAPPLELRGGAFFISGGRRGSEVETFELWYSRQLYYILHDTLPVWTKRLRVSPKKVSIKRVISLWGSCSAISSITFSSRLALVPQRLLEYVVVHELAHLKHMNHSPEFWQELEKHLPDYRERRSDLKRDGLDFRWW